jgi:hypothetical protein
MTLVIRLSFSELLRFLIHWIPPLDGNEKAPPAITVDGAFLLDPSGRRDLNPGPPAPEAGALTGLRYAPSPSTA